MNVQELIKYLQTLPGDTKVTCCEDRGEVCYRLTEAPVSEYLLDYCASTKTLKIGMF